MYISANQQGGKAMADKRDYYDAGALKNEYDQAILMTYVAN